MFSAALVIVAAVIVALVSCGQSSGLIRPAAPCFPAPLRVDPPGAQPGSAVTVESGAAACSLGYPPGHRYTITLQHRDVVAPPLRVAVAPDGRFRATIDIPATFPSGDAVIRVTGSPYDDCDDTASCVGYSVPLTIG